MSLGTVLCFKPGSKGEFFEGIEFLTRASERGDGSAAERLGVLHELEIGGLKRAKTADFYNEAKEKWRQGAFFLR